MWVDQTSPVGDLATKLPGALRVFDELRIDYCLSGARSLACACGVCGLDVRDVVARIEKAADEAPAVDAVWLERPLAALVEHIVSRYHASTRGELQTLRAATAALLGREGARPETRVISSLLAELENEMIPHMVKEERILFPYVVELEARARAGNRRPRVDLPTTENPLRTMMREHRHADDTLGALRRACSDYVVPADAPPGTAALYARLEELERTLHHHVHLESNVLFRRAMELEAEQG